MPRKSKGPRLWLYKRKGYPATWVILDRGRQISTGCREDDHREAEKALARYIAEKYTPKKSNAIEEIFVADVMKVYLEEHVPTIEHPETVVSFSAPVIEWWGAKTLADIRRTTCQEYVRWRLQQGVKLSTVRNDLSVLRAAINYYHKEYGPLSAVPKVSVPEKPPPRIDYFLTRKQVADRIRVARRDPWLRHIARMLLIGVYTGTRPGAMLNLRWVPSSEGGWFDLESQTLHRKGIGKRDTNKRQPKARIHARLLPHLKRWRRMDMAKGITHVIHFHGRPIEDCYKAWKRVAILAGQAVQVGENEWRVMDGPHTVATQQQRGRCNQGRTFLRLLDTSECHRKPL